MTWITGARGIFSLFCNYTLKIYTLKISNKEASGRTKGDLTKSSPNLAGTSRALSVATRSGPNVELKMKPSSMLRLATIATVASFGFIATPNAAESVRGVPSGVGTLSPPHIDFVPVRASGLHLGMASSEVARIMGNAVQSRADVDVGVRVIDFPAEPIATKVTITDGKLSGVTLDIAGIDEHRLPSFSRLAWPGMSSVSVRYLLGTPSDVRTYTFFNVRLDELIFRRPSEPDLSVFFVADRVVAKQVGGDIPVDIFRVVLPSPPNASSEEEDEGSVLVGMKASDVKALYGATHLDVNYTVKGQPAERAIYETHSGGHLPNLHSWAASSPSLPIWGGCPRTQYFRAADLLDDRGLKPRISSLREHRNSWVYAVH
jgi:hypothetical protein